MRFEEISINHRTRRRAMNDCRCIWCGEAVAIGERYTDRRYRFDGEFMHDRMHEECFAAMKRSFADDPYNEGFGAYDFDRGTTDPAGTAASRFGTVEHNAMPEGRS